jgi:hypothetical protein
MIILFHYGKKPKTYNVHSVYYSMTQDEFTTEELAFAAHDKLDVLIDILIEKGLLSEEEYIQKLKDHYKK